jgi:methylated-DNA-[protein]-cysteine S-methyltransferase
VTIFAVIESPIDPLLLTSDGEALTGLYMSPHRHGPARTPDWRQDDRHQVFAEAARLLASYFEGELREFDLPLRLEGTEFQRRVWGELRRIPYGVTVSYGELADRIGSPGSSRAVGLANGRNPVSIIVPCHRVIGASGALTGYGGGVERKAALLDFEADVVRFGPHPLVVLGGGRV